MVEGPRDGSGAIKVRLSAAYATLYLSYGLYLPFFSLWAISLVKNETILAYALSVPIILRTLLMPGFGYIYDRSKPKSLNYIIYILIVLMSVALATIFRENFWIAVSCIALISMFFNFLPMALDTFTLDALREVEIPYSSVRLWGSIAVAVSTLAFGITLTKADISLFAWLFIPSIVLTLLASLWLPKIDTQKQLAVSGISFDLPEGAWTMFFAASMVLGSHMAFQTYGSILLEREGFGKLAISGFWFLSIISEIAAFAFAPKWPPGKMLAVAAAFSILRWVSFSFSSSAVVIVIGQSFHGITFAFAHLAIMAFIQTISSQGSTGRIKSVWLLFNGLVFGAVIFVSGLLWPALGSLIYLAMTGLVLIGAGSLIIRARSQKIM